MLYPRLNVNKIIQENMGYPKNIEVEENRAQKKEEPKDKLRTSNILT